MYDVSLSNHVLSSGAALCDGKDDQQAGLARPSKLHKKKRKKKSRIEESVKYESDECDAKLSDAEEQLKQMELSERVTFNGGSKSTKRKRKKGKDHGTPLKKSLSGTPVRNSLIAAVDEKQIDDVMIEGSSPMQQKGSQKKKRLNDGLSTSVEPVRDDYHDEVEFLSNDDDVLTSERLKQSSQVALDNSSQSKFSEEADDHLNSEEDTADTQQDAVSDREGSDGDDVMPLVPLRHEGKSLSVKEKVTVQRQLPQWITEAEIIPDDIIDHSMLVG